LGPRGRSHRVRRALALGAIALGLVAPCGARAQGTEVRPDTADVLFERGKASLKAGDWAAGCADFQASFDLEPSVSALVKLARCRDHEGRPASALLQYRRALELNRTLVQSPERVQELAGVIHSELANLEPKVPLLHLVVRPTPAGLDVRVDGRAVPPSDVEAAIPVDPGEREVVVRAPGYREERVRIAFAAGAPREVRVELQPAPAPDALVRGDGEDRGASVSTAPQERQEARPAEQNRPASRQGILGLTVGAAGIITLGVAGYFGYRTLALVDDSRPYCNTAINQCEQLGLDRLNDARQAQTVGLVLAGVGGALTTAGLVLYFSSHTGSSADPKAPASARMALFVDANVDKAQAAVRGVW
jgi:hypothetical protein